jgi:hypothetical protein
VFSNTYFIIMLLAKSPSFCSSIISGNGATTKSDPNEKPDVMRKHMRRVIAESLERNSDVVYIGDDVEQGGNYFVEGLAEEFPSRVLDFPPDETTLVGAAIGFSQVGLCPIVEIPDSCDLDKFFKTALSNRSTRRQQPSSTGMVLRIHGFQPGIFGWNDQTTQDMLDEQPGIDILCYSNGLDYARGFRNAIVQAKAGRIVILIDCKNLLGLRHLFGKDRAWERKYPTDVRQAIGFHNVTRYCSTSNSPSTRAIRKIAIVSYGNGVIEALLGREKWYNGKDLSGNRDRVMACAVDVIDCPLLSEVPDGIKELLQYFRYDRVIFADVIKEEPSPLINMIVQLQAEKLIPDGWVFLQAPTSNSPPRIDDIVSSLNAMI